MDPRKVRKNDNWFMMHFDLFNLINQSKRWQFTFLSNLKLHFTSTRSSTFSGFNLALLGLTTLPATEKTWSDLDEAAGSGKTTLTSLARRGNWDSWWIHHSSRSTEDGLSYQAKVGKTSFLTPPPSHWRHFATNIVSTVSPNFGGLFLWKNTVL